MTAISHAPVAVRRYGWVPGEIPDDLVLGAPQTGGTYERALLLLERDGVPWGRVGVAAAGGIVRGASVERAAALQIAGEPWASTSAPGQEGPALPLRVVITSCQDPWRAVRSVGALLREPDPNLEVVVVERRREASTLLRVLTETFPEEPRLTWRDEPRPGRADARNRGAQGAAGGLIAFLDDDALVHPYWVAAMREAMRGTGADAIGVGLGSTIPLALETEAQWLWFRASAAGGRPGASSGLDRPMPWEPSGAGAFESGICLSVSALQELGGFDGRLGSGTPSQGGDDVDVVLRARRAGYAVVQVPRAVVWREYPDALPSIERAAFARGVGVSATMTKQLVAGPGTAGRVQAASTVMRLGHHSRLRPPSDLAPDSGSPRRLIVMERLGLAAGPLAYARSALRGRGAPQ